MDNKSLKITITAMAVVINIVLGTVVSAIKIPFLFMDTLGTVFAAITLGPLYGAIAGGVSNIIMSLGNPASVPYALVNIAVGIVAGVMALKFKFNIKIAVITGVILGIVCPLIGTPITIFLGGGFSGDALDVAVAFLRQTGQSIFIATFVPRVFSNMIDKIATCVIAAVIKNKIPKRLSSKLEEV